VPIHSCTLVLALGDFCTMPNIPPNIVDYDEIPFQQRRFLNGFKPLDKDYRLLAVEKLGGECVKCGYNEDLVCIDIEHIKKDGKEERKRYDSVQMYKMIYNAFRLNVTEAIEIIKTRYQPMCVICHRKKTYYNKENTGDVFLQLHNSNVYREIRELYGMVRYAMRLEIYK
jgi:DNA-directed RNA polymerase subunit M/transcription elongation factor TFIIS